MNIRLLHFGSEQIRWLVATLITLLTLGWTANLHRILLGKAFLVQEFTLLVLGLCMALIYLSKDFSGKQIKSRPALVDIFFAVCALCACGYAAWRYNILSEQMFYYPTESYVLGALIVLLVLEGLRRMVGWPLLTIVLFFVGYGLVGDLFPAPFTTRPWALADLAPHLALDTTAMVGLPLSIGVTMVIPFLFFGILLNTAGGGEFFSDLAVAVMGQFRGGAAKISIIASALFGTISGSAVSNVASTGIISIPLMQKSGFSGRIAAATEAVASTGGQFMPPVMGAAAFLMAELSQTAYQTIVLAAVLPAIFFFIAVFMQSDSDAVRYNISSIPKEQRKPLLLVLKQGGHFLLPFAVLILMLFSYNQTPQMSALGAAITVAIVGMARGYSGDRLGFGEILTAVRKAGFASMEIIAIVAAAGFVIGILNATGLVFNLTMIIIEIAGGQLVPLLLLAAVISIVLGMGMPTVAVYVLLASLVVPALIAAGVPKLSAHMFVMYFGMMSMITPPIAIAAFAASSIAAERPLGVSLTAMRYSWLAYLVPFIFVFRPELLLSPTDSGLMGLVEVIGATMLLTLIMNGALSGYLKGHLALLSRLTLLIAGCAILMAVTTQSYQIISYLGALVLFGLVAKRELFTGCLQGSRYS